MKSHLSTLFHDVSVPVSCLSYLLEQDSLCESTAQVILAQESDLKSWEILLTALENQERPESGEGSAIECFKEALSFGEQTNLLERIEKELHRPGDKNRLTVRRPASTPMSFSVSSGWRPPTRHAQVATVSGETCECGGESMRQTQAEINSFFTVFVRYLYWTDAAKHVERWPHAVQSFMNSFMVSLEGFVGVEPTDNLLHVCLWWCRKRDLDKCDDGIQPPPQKKKNWKICWTWTSVT